MTKVNLFNLCIFFLYIWLFDKWPKTLVWSTDKYFMIWVADWKLSTEDNCLASWGLLIDVVQLSRVKNISICNEQLL